MIPFVIVGFFLVSSVCVVLEILGVHREYALQLAAFLVVVIAPTILYIYVISSPVTLPK